MMREMWIAALCAPLLAPTAALADEPVTPPDLPGAPAPEDPPPAPTDTPALTDAPAAGSDAAAPTPGPDGLVAAPLRPEDQNVDRTEFRAAGGNAGAVAVARRAPRPEPPLEVAASGFAAGYGYSGHPTRTSGFESQVRGDAWRGLDWGLHASYTLDVINADDGMTGSFSATTFHDLDVGGSARLAERVPTWAFVEAHALEGGNRYAKGGAILLGLGRALGPVKAEISLGGISTSGDTSLQVTARVARARITPWLGAALTAIVTDDGPYDTTVTTGGLKLAGGPEITLAPANKITVVLDGLFGERAFALLARGEVAEDLPDVQRTTLRGFVWWTLTDRVRAYVGASYRTATAPVSHDYTLASGFAGAVVSLP